MSDLVQARAQHAELLGIDGLVCSAEEAAALRKVILEKFNMSLGAGLGRLTGRVFRIGHLGSLNDLTLAGTLAGVEMGLELNGIPYRKGGVDAALAYLTEQAKAR